MDFTDQKSLSANSFFRVEEFEMEKGMVSNCSFLPRPFNAFGLITEGGADFLVGNNVVTVNRGDVIFIPVGAQYIANWKGDLTRKTVLFFKLESPDFDIKSGYEVQKITVSDPDALYRRLIELKNGSKEEGISAIKTIAECWTLCAELAQKLKKSEIKGKSREIQQAMDYIGENFSHNINMQKLARSMFISESRFYVRFKKETGFTPVQYLNYIRIQEAVNLVRNGKTSIEELVTLTGFNSAVYFRKKFKLLTGKKPSVFIKSMNDLRVSENGNERLYEL